MGDPILTADAVAYCGHTAPPQPAGKLAFLPKQTAFTVGGSPVLLVADVAAAKVALGCPSRCATVVPPVTGSAVLTVNGVPVATKATTANTNAGTVVLHDAGQTVLTAD